mgnify:CR=1 FL=1
MQDPTQTSKSKLSSARTWSINVIKHNQKIQKKNKNAKNCDEKSYEWPPLGDYEMLAG